MGQRKQSEQREPKQSHERLKQKTICMSVCFCEIKDDFSDLENFFYIIKAGERNRVSKNEG